LGSKQIVCDVISNSETKCSNYQKDTTMLFGNRRSLSLHSALINLVALVGLVGVFNFGIHQNVVAQSEMQAEPDKSRHQTLSTTPLTPKPGFKPHTAHPAPPEMPARTMQRTGTAINGARNSVSIKSTDAGIVHRPAAPSAPLSPLPPMSPMAPMGQFAPNCINCGIIDFINIAQSNAINAMASGMIAGTIARKMGEHGSHHGSQPEHHQHRGHQQHYQVGVTMQDGSHQVIIVPDITGLQRGNMVQLKDGILIPE